MGKHSRALSWLNDEELEEFLGDVRNLVCEPLCSRQSALDHYLERVFDDAKLIRPALLLATARRGTRPNMPLAIRAAAGLELVHEATLYHDDIVDLSELRRGQPAVQSLFGARTAAVSGSKMIYRALALCADLPPNAKRELVLAARRLGRGQMREMSHAGLPGPRPLTHLRIMADKTASLFVLATGLGATLGALGELERRYITRFSVSFAMSYQLLDDLRDLFAGPEQLGRMPGGDIRAGILTLPLLTALGRERTRRGSSRLWTLVNTALEDGTAENIRVLRTTLIDIGAGQATISTARQWIDRTWEALSTVSRQWPKTIGSPFVDVARLLDGHLNEIAAHISQTSCKKRRA